MAPEQQAEEVSSNNSSAGEESGQEQQDQQQSPTPEDGANGGQQQSNDGKLPDDHPVVKALAKANAKLDKQSLDLQELNDLRAKSTKITQLEQELNDRPTKEMVETLQSRYDRLEAFAQAVGLGRALDSRTFTRDLFETDKDIKDLVAEWNRANPSATSTALSSTSGPVKQKHDPNELLRIAAGKA